ncbi:hypothetical protein [Aquabacterium sp.]|uniref:deoxynucleotide monophosphate kinase family protein n=1 Tax=Aquabacterium sp. TaxID=1872578 RepID=UPI002616B302|nr:hypothetical protein [Aquabacterium sp.]MDD2975542.1 hypothetical protein [Aquabacterium sp.]
MFHINTVQPIALLGLTGKASAGKNSCATALADLGFTSIAFADAIRTEVARAWGIDERMLTERVTKETPLPGLAITRCQSNEFINWAVLQHHSVLVWRSPRWVMQRWGTEFRLSQNTLHWIHLVNQQIHQLTHSGINRIVITDVRTQDEAAFVRLMGGKLARVHRQDGASMASDTGTHETERTDHIQVDFDIVNTSTLDKLRQSTHRAVIEQFTRFQGRTA